jgi:iron complex transport system substrate-binding protein
MNDPRIVSLLASGTEMVCGLGLRAALVGISHECDYPPDVLALPRVTRTRVDPAADAAAIDRQVRRIVEEGGPLYEVDAAAIRSLRPSLIVTQTQCNVCAVTPEDVRRAFGDALSLDGVTMVSLNPVRLNDIFEDIRRLGAAAGVAERADRYVASLSARIDRVSSGWRDLPLERRPRVCVLEWTDPLMPAGNWIPEVVSLAGGRPLLAAAGEHSRPVAPGDIVALDPDVIVVAPCGMALERAGQEARNLARHPWWGSLRAVGNGEVYAFDANAYLTRSGPRVVDSIELLAALLHPDRFTLPALPAPAWGRLPTA